MEFPSQKSSLTGFLSTETPLNGNTAKQSNEFFHIWEVFQNLCPQKSLLLLPVANTTVGRILEAIRRVASYRRKTLSPVFNRCEHRDRSPIFPVMPRDVVVKFCNHIFLFSVKRNFKTTTELANANVLHATEGTVKELVQQIHANQSDQTSNTDQLVNAMTSSIDAVHLQTEITIDNRS